ncbi:hypothetical protein [Neorhodopirellula lusitana]|uniref:hypothetical protein n=1 Tax=Neorhodopirellula lusitana TaxID=445327 RepID=UPI00384F01B2
MKFRRYVVRLFLILDAICLLVGATASGTLTTAHNNTIAEKLVPSSLLAGALSFIIASIAYRPFIRK